MCKISLISPVIDDGLSGLRAGWWPTISLSATFLSQTFCMDIGFWIVFFRFRSCHPYQLGVSGLEWESAGFDTVPSTLSNFSSPVR